MADEVRRVRRYFGTMGALFVLVAILLPSFGGDPTYKRILWGALGASFLAYAGFVWRVKEPSRYRPLLVLVPIQIGCLGGFAAGLYYGMFSPAAMMFTLHIYCFSLSTSPLVARSTYVSCALLQAAGMLLTGAGIVPDAGVVDTAQVPPLEKLGIAALVELVYAMTFVFGRQSQRVTREAVENFAKAVKQVGQREALLQEAHRELDRALGPNERGRYSGERIGPWLCQRVVGRGGMGEIYEARKVGADQVAALKVLYPDYDNPEYRPRFLREASLARELDTPHVVEILEVGETESGSPYIAMELLRGQDLGRILRQQRRLSLEEVGVLLGQVAHALEQARQAGIVHRDLKPQNLFRAEGPSGDAVWKVLDFGVAKAGQSEATRTGEVLGTAGYMAPEQTRGGGAAVDHRVDVFALTAVAYRCLTGQPPFEGEDLRELLIDTALRQPRRPSELVPLAPDVELVLALGLAKHPDDRLATAAELHRAFVEACHLELPDALRIRARSLLAREPWDRRVGV